MNKLGLALGVRYSPLLRKSDALLSQCCSSLSRLYILILYNIVYTACTYLITKQIEIGVIGHYCFPEVGEILPPAFGIGQYFPKQFPIVTSTPVTICILDRCIIKCIPVINPHPCLQSVSNICVSVGRWVGRWMFYSSLVTLRGPRPPGPRGLANCCLTMVCLG